MNSCPSGEQIQQLLDERLSDDEREAIETHIEGCAACQGTLARLGADASGLDWRILRRSPPAAVPESDADLARRLEENPPRDIETISFGNERDEPAPVAFPGPPTEKGPLGQLDSFAIRKQLGDGRFGVVYQACDELDRLVAIKVLKPELAASARERARFEHEARKAAAVKHDHIVTIYQVGHTPGFPLPYLVMEYVDGEALSDRLQREGVFEPKEAARIVRQVALALAAAHARGLVHRDIKPSNILLEAGSGRAKLTDFGLARVSEAAGASTSQSGRIVGTPAYMSPEQVTAPHRLDGRSDLYSLGMVLYELLTEERAFRGMAHLVLQQVVHDEPRPARKLNDRIPRDLETITLKCLAKEPGRRYQSAADLADDLQCWLDSKPIQARPVGQLERLWRWCRRNPVVAWLTTAAATLLVLAAASATVAAVQSNLVAQQEERLRKEAEDRADAEAKAKQELEAGLYLNHIALAHRELSADNLGRAQKLLDDCPPALRHWEWDYLKRLCRREPTTLKSSEEGVFGAAFSPDGRRMATANGDGTIRLFDVEMAEQLQTLLGHNDYVFSVAFHPDGNHLASASADGTVRVWNLTTGKEVFIRDGHRGDFMGTAYGVAFSPDGQRLAAGSEDGILIIWNATDGQRLLDLPGHGRMVISVAFSPDRLLLATGSFGGVLRIWDAQIGRLLHEVSAHDSSIGAVAFRPDGRWLATASHDRTVKVWDATTGKWLRTLPGHTGLVVGLAFSPDGRRLASTGEDKTVKIWDTETGQEVLNLRGHTLVCRCVAFSPNGRRLASASLDGTVRIWDATPLTGSEGQEASTLHHDGEVWSVAFSPDGRRIASGSWDKAVKLWDANTGATLRTFRYEGRAVMCVTFSPPDGKYIASGFRRDQHEGTVVKVWDAATGGEVRTISEGGAFCVTFSPDGQYLLKEGENHTVQAWDVQTGQKLGIIGRHAKDVRCLKFSPDGRSLASASSDWKVKVWEWDAARLAQRQEPLLTIEPLRVGGFGDRVTFSPDSRRLVTGGEQHTVKVWDVSNGKEVWTLHGHTGDVFCVAVSPDGRWIASAGEDTTVRLWDARTREPVHKLRGHTGVVMGLMFSPDSRRLVSGSRDHTVKVWDLKRLKLKQ